MPIYHQLGNIPRKRHIVFRRPDGGLYAEELMGHEGFTGTSALLYHIHPPTTVKSARKVADVRLEADEETSLRHRHFLTARATKGGSPTLDRIPLLFNSDIAMYYVEPDVNDAHCYRNSQADEVVYVVEGTGTLESVFGDLPYKAGDYVVLHRNITFRWRLDAGVPQKFLVMESRGHVRFPRRYLNDVGQFIEGAPFCERDIRRPTTLQPHDERGDFPILVKQYDALNELVLDHHPFDVVGWDGYFYPWAFNIHDFEPIVGRIHQPPPVHQTFQGDGFVICSFCPRPYDFDPEAIPAPYNHSNVDSDEVLFYASSEFMSRKGIEYGSITHHPDGLPHGPHPGRTEASIGAKYTNELAVMMDSFRPLKVAKAAMAIEDPKYHQSWLDQQHSAFAPPTS
ncbi:MAG: homogentisate 1,2-dioxygenase [Gemmatimonadetes bacterium]|jgi:homogentisate 1,2-dioxygenase|nr:homogentisate 1,2-dioxygenase [Gemmatimonadota bacterium]MBK6841614.1 homogentisate 1,2-dioxygenase [Gemmatimonadota bacterium]MBK7835319.1 homogentisate 1,2-dioxygenase [Gemmatimonadota bacterium]MBK8645369.1 homogentisate 1,2-dioxygenase [Gemmatimonadota bacterium]MBK9406661.1 homogentisate 1,2-dioxygenase [Gemmatimonadota bacterium]